MKQILVPVITAILITAGSVNAETTVKLKDIDLGDYRIDCIGDVVINSTHYDVIFHHGVTYNSLPGTKITFTSEADADNAIDAINEAILAIAFDATAPDTQKTATYRIPMLASPVQVDIRLGSHAANNPLRYQNPHATQAKLPDGVTLVNTAYVTFALTPIVDGDSDGDGLLNSVDNCPGVANPGQENNDGDAEGDICDDDDDNDGVPDTMDNCPIDANFDQADADFDGLGDVCDASGDDTVVEQVAGVIATMVEEIVDANVPGGTGMIKRLTSNGSVLRKLDNAVSAFDAGAIDCPTYLAELQSALDALESFDIQLAANIANGTIVDPEATALLNAVDDIRGHINNLIAAAGC